MAHKIGPECIGCGACAGGCPTGCIHEDGGVYVINAAECIDCGTCAGSVPQAQSKLNNFYLKRKSEPSGSLFLSFFV